MPANDPACAGVKPAKAWIRGVVRLIDNDAVGADDRRKGPFAPVGTVVTVYDLNDDKGALRAGLLVAQATVSNTDGSFAIEKPRGKRVGYAFAFSSQLRFDIERAFFEFKSVMFPDGACIEVFLNKSKLP